MTERRSRIAGSLYGCLVGDALGCPVEGWTTAQIRRRLGRLDEMTSTQYRPRPAGLHSDDGQQTLAVCDAVLAQPDDPAPELADLLVRMWKEGGGGRSRFGAHRGTGRNFREAIKRIESAGDPTAGAIKTAGPGAAMRIAPLALYYRNDANRLRQAVLDTSLITHSDIRAIASAGAVAISVASAFQPQKQSTRVPANDLVGFVRALEADASDRIGCRDQVHEFSQAFAAMLADADREPTEVMASIATRANVSASTTGGPANPYCLASVITACYLGLTSSSFESAVVTAVELGEDADTVGAMTGAIAGARAGIGAIPPRWLDALWAWKHLEDRVDGLDQRKRGFVPEKCLVELERRWTQEAEKQQRRSHKP